jgi:acyl-CoA thioesterase-1
MNKIMTKHNSLLIVLFFVICSCNSGTKKGGEAVKDSIMTDSIKKESVKTIVFFGNSLTAGYGVDLSEAYPSLIQKKIDSLGLAYKVVNAGLSGETSAGGVTRVGWVLKQKIDIFVLELGANDGLRGINVKETEKNLQQIIDTVRKTSPETKVVLTGMQIPPSMGPKYTDEFQKMFKDLAAKNQTILIPFLLEGVAGYPKLNQPDGIHPTAEGYKVVAENVWNVLYPLVILNIDL